MIVTVYVPRPRIVATKQIKYQPIEVVRHGRILAYVTRKMPAMTTISPDAPAFTIMGHVGVTTYASPHT
ncbi:hypothetical protein ACWEQ7_14525 [Streptomyces sp. NPDC004069]